MTETKERIIPLSSDVCFRQVFKQKKFLKYFLEDVLEEQIEDLEYLDSVVEGNNVKDKECRLDIRVRLKNKTLLDIEMQNSKKGDMFKRSKYYLSRLIERSIKVGEDYNAVPKCICINILNYSEEYTKEYITKFQLYNEKDIEKIEIKSEKKLEIMSSDEIKIIFIDITKEEDKSKIAAWKKIFKDGEVMKENKDKRLEEVVEEIRRLSQNKEAMRLYELEQEAMLEKISRENYVKRTATEEGIQQGIQQNIKEVALNMNKNNIDKKIIVKSLNITIEELEDILKTNMK